MHNCAPILIFIFVLKYFWDWDGGKRNLNLNEMGLRSSSIFQLTYTLTHSTQFCIADTQKNDSRDDDDVILLFKSRSEWASEKHLTIGNAVSLDIHYNFFQEYYEFRVSRATFP